MTLFCLWPRPRRPRRSPQEHSVRRRVSSRRAPSKAGAKTQVWRERLLYGYRGRARCQQRPLAFFWFFGQSTHPERETDVRARCSYCVPAAKEVEAERAAGRRAAGHARTAQPTTDRPDARAVACCDGTSVLAARPRLVGLARVARRGVGLLGLRLEGALQVVDDVDEPLLRHLDRRDRKVRAVAPAAPKVLLRHAVVEEDSRVRRADGLRPEGGGDTSP